jgi:hypothetical protein
MSPATANPCTARHASIALRSGNSMQPREATAKSSVLAMR